MAFQKKSNWGRDLKLAKAPEKAKVEKDEANWIDSVPSVLKSVAIELGRGPYQGMLSDRPGRAKDWLELTVEGIEWAKTIAGGHTGFERARIVADELDRWVFKLRPIAQFQKKPEAVREDAEIFNSKERRFEWWGERDGTWMFLRPGRDLQED
jgi:hypothetical protein